MIAEFRINGHPATAILYDKKEDWERTLNQLTERSAHMADRRAKRGQNDNAQPGKGTRFVSGYLTLCAGKADVFLFKLGTPEACRNDFSSIINCNNVYSSDSE